MQITNEMTCGSFTHEASINAATLKCTGNFKVTKLGKVSSIQDGQIYKDGAHICNFDAAIGTMDSSSEELKTNLRNVSAALMGDATEIITQSITAIEANYATV